MKKVLCVLLSVLFIMCFLNVPAFADGKAVIALSKKNATVGENVTVSLTYSSNFKMYAIDGTLRYNNAVLKYVSGGSQNINSTVKITEGLSGEKSRTFKIVFKTLAAGSGSLSFSCEAAGDSNKGEHNSAAAGTAINVTELKPSTNNNLGSLKVTGAAISPAFKSGTLNYTATVKYDVTNINIRANASAGDAKVAGVGTFDLEVGNNTRSITVTAASGDKKTYTVKIKRLSEEETAEQEKAELQKNPLYFEYAGTDRFIVPDITNLAEFEGFEKATFEIKEETVGYLKDKAGKYNLVWATDEEGVDGAFYNRGEDGQLSKVNYLQTSGRIYIVEPFEDGIEVSDNYVLSEQEINGDSIPCYRYSDEQFNGACIFNCYINGESGYYRFDASDNSVNLEPDFPSGATETVAEPDEEENMIDKFRQLGTSAKAVILLMCLAVLLIFILIILIIVKAASGKKETVGEDETPGYSAVEQDDGDNAGNTGLLSDIPEDKPAEAKTVKPEATEPNPGKTEVLGEDDPKEQTVEPTGKTERLGDANELPPADPEEEDGKIDTSEFIDMDDD